MSCLPLTPEERAALKVRIAKLEAQYDALMSGTSVIEFIDQNGEKVRYSTANTDKLLAYINSLKAQLCDTFSRRYRPRPMGFIFPR